MLEMDNSPRFMKGLIKRKPMIRKNERVGFLTELFIVQPQS
jgi:hypothetical protein